MRNPFLLFLPFIGTVLGYDAKFSDGDHNMLAACSGIWVNDRGAAGSTYINVTFDSKSRGSIAMVIYEWKDTPYLGRRIRSEIGAEYDYRTYLCTPNAVQQSLCTKEEEGKFILDLPANKTISDTSFWSAHVQFPKETTRRNTNSPLEPPGQANSPDIRGTASNPSPRDTPYMYDNANPIHYIVETTGYYCVGVISVWKPHDDDLPYYPQYTGLAHFQNIFEGKLPASHWPKLPLYLIFTLIYLAIAGIWRRICLKEQDNQQPVQCYFSLLFAILPLEMLSKFALYSALNLYGKETAANVLLIVVATLNALRVTMSLFLLLLLSLGLSVGETLPGKAMIRAKALSAAHFICGTLYAIGYIQIDMENRATYGFSQAFLTLISIIEYFVEGIGPALAPLILFAIPLAFMIFMFLLWILKGLYGTCRWLQAIEQHDRLYKFIILRRILVIDAYIIVVLVVLQKRYFNVGFFADYYNTSSWSTRWICDDYLELVYLVSVVVVAYQSSSRVSVAMYEPVPQDEEDEEDEPLDRV